MKTNVELLEEEINTAFNVFGKADRMKVLLEKIKKESKNDFEFSAEVETIGFTSYHNHGKLKLTIPFRYDLIKDLDKTRDLKVSLKYES